MSHIESGKAKTLSDGFENDIKTTQFSALLDFTGTKYFIVLQHHFHFN